jgi:hypothetical protein
LLVLVIPGLYGFPRLAHWEHTLNIVPSITTVLRFSFTCRPHTSQNVDDEVGKFNSPLDNPV